MNGTVFHFAKRVVQRAARYQPLYPCLNPGKKLFAKPSVLPSIMSYRHYKNDSKKAAMAKELHERLIWVDCEMTGLDINKDHILEIACLITDGDLNLIAEGPNIIIHQPEEILNSMNDWCVEHHGKSGLTEAVRASKVSLQEAEFMMLSFVRQHSAPGFCPLAGNSVHADKVFLTKYMPLLTKHLHYRIVDVSTVKELCRRWYPEDYAAAPSKQAAHRALDDIMESIKELKYYRKALFK